MEEQEQDLPNTLITITREKQGLMACQEHSKCRCLKVQSSRALLTEKQAPASFGSDTDGAQTPELAEANTIDPLGAAIGAPQGLAVTDTP